MTIRASLDVFLGRTKSLGGFGAASGSGCVVEGVGSGVAAFGAGRARVARAIVVATERCDVVLCRYYAMSTDSTDILHVMLIMPMSTKIAV